MKNEVKNSSLQLIKDALLKRALGYYSDEIVEEYVYDENNNEKKVKKKVTTKHVPADLSASKILLDYFKDASSSYDLMTDEELDKEALRLIKEYQSISQMDLIKEIKEDNSW